MSRGRPSFPSRPERGSAMLAALCFAAVFALCLSSYVTLCYYSLAISNRYLGSSHGIELAEAGLEDSLWALNNSTWTGWTLSGGTATETETGFTFDSGATGTVALQITGYNTTSPSITSVGTMTLSDGTTITRTLTSSASPAPEFINAAGTQGLNSSGVAVAGMKLMFTGAGGLIDSYDSRQGTYASQTPGSSAVLVSTEAQNAATVQLSGSTLHGYSVTCVGSTTSYTAGAHVTLANILTSANPNQPVYLENYPAYANNLANGITSSMTLGYSTDTTPRVYYTWGNINLGSGSVLTIAGPVIIVCYGSVTVSGTGQIVINNTQVSGNYVCSLELHAESAVSIGGNGINNQTLLPKRLALLGSYSNNQAPTISTTVPFYGVIYFPTETVTVSSNLTIYGSVAANKVTFSAAPTIHYDMALRYPDSSSIDAAFNCVSAPMAIAGWSTTN